MLDAIAPGRIDLGLGRAPGSDGRTAFALNPLANERPAQFPNDVRDLTAWVTGSPLPEGHPFATVHAYPAGETSPEIWMLGSSDYGAQVAAHFGLPYAFAWFFTDGPGRRPGARPLPHTLPAERAPSRAAHARCACGRWRPTRRRRRSTTSARAPAFACCAIAASSLRWSRPRRRSPTPIQRHEAARIAEFRRQAFVGTGAQVAERIADLAKQLNVQEMAVVTWATDEQARRKSYRLLAETMGLTASARRW